MLQFKLATCRFIQHPFPDRSYYRLKSIDADGKWENLLVVSVNRTGSNAVKLRANPVHTNLSVLSSLSHGAVWRLINVSGQIIGRGSLVQGQNNIDVSALLPGKYWLQAENSAGVKTLSFIKQ